MIYSDALVCCKCSKEILNEVSICISIKRHTMLDYLCIECLRKLLSKEQST